jgi:hypothetical protein
VAALVVPLAQLRAQQLRGEVMLPDSTTRAVGVVVIATNEKGSEVARALTTDRGDFVVRLPVPGRYGLRLLRIGFRPTTVPPVTIGEGETQTVHLVLGAQAVSLAAVRVRGERVCRIREDSGQVVAGVWEQARTALSATQLTDAGRPINATVLKYERTMDRAGRMVRAETSSVRQGTTTHAFESIPTDLLARFGYVVPTGEDRTYYAPDADVLLSEPFAALHCFHVEPPPADHAGWIGIGFRPARERRGINDIEGTLWLDRQTAALQRLDYTYTNLEWQLADAGAGGFVDFRRLATGQWIVSAWAIHLPRAQSQRSARGQVRVEITAIQVSGGEVLEATRDGVVLHRAPGMGVDAALATRDPFIGSEGARVELVGTTSRAVTDASGRARFDRVLPGKYMAKFITPAMERLGVAPMEREIEVRAGLPTNAFSFPLPKSDELLAELCGEVIAKRGDSMIFGLLAGPDRRALPEATMTASWQRDFRSGGQGRVSYNVENREVATDSRGNWRLCGVPSEAPLFLRVATKDDFHMSLTLRVPAKWRLARFDLPDTTAKAP